MDIESQIKELIRSEMRVQFEALAVEFGLNSKAKTKDTMTTEEVCALLKCTGQTLWRWQNEGKLSKPTKVGRRKLFLRDEVMDLVR